MARIIIISSSSSSGSNNSSSSSSSSSSIIKYVPTKHNSNSCVITPKLGVKQIVLCVWMMCLFATK